MVNTEIETLESMYQHKAMTTKKGEEYVVRGALITCDKGKGDNALNLPKDHGVATSDDRPLITVKDTMYRNVGRFGYCEILEAQCSPDLEDWDIGNSTKQIRDVNTGTNEYAVVKGATATCRHHKDWHHGEVRIVTSGQAVPDYSGEKLETAVIIEEGVSGSWSDTKNDLFGQLIVNSAGVYNLSITIDSKDEDKFVGGTVFMYRKKGYINKTAKYIGAFPFRSTQKDDKTSWIQMLLSKGEDYYIEIDLPNIERYNYKWYGNFEKSTLSLKVNGGAMWSLLREVMLHTYDIYDMEYITEYIMFLDKHYMKALDYILAKVIADDAIKSDLMDFIKGVLITVIGVVDTAMGVILSAFDLLISYASTTVIEELYRDIQPYIDSGKSAKVDLIVVMPLTAGLEYKAKVYDWNSKDISGEKYLKGEFSLLAKSSLSDALDSAVDAINTTVDDLQ